MPVQVIRATRQQAAAPLMREKLKVACYARVSTDSDDQETSYEAQITHYTNQIQSTPEWTFAGAYADEGISGTSRRRREQFNRLMEDCEAGLIDLILTKSISRWGRNTVDNLNTVRKLRDMGVGVKFEKEGIYTLDNTGEMLITILSSFAQQESDSISKNVRLGIQYHFQQGKGRLNTTQFLGYDKDPKDKYMLVIVPEEAEIVRRIYREYLEGYSPGMIASHLTAEGVKTPAGKDTWFSSTITSILENEKYCGDLLMQKYYVEDFLTHKIVKNEGTLPQYFVEDHHPPIVPKEVYYQVQGELQRRSLLKYDPTKIRFGSTNALRGRLVCGICGRTLKQYKSPAETTWRCRKRSYEKKSITKEVEPGCPCRIVREKDVKRAIIRAFGEIPGRREELLRLQGAIWDGTIKMIDEQIKGVEEKKQRLMERLEAVEDPDGEEAAFLSGEIENQDVEYTCLVLKRADAANLDVQIRLLLEMGEKKMKGGEPACYDYDEFFRRTGHPDEDPESFSNEMVIRYLDKVVVHEDRYEVIFKAGVKVEIPA